jgi:hypothetical protein
MPGTQLLKRVGALVVALTALVALQTQAKPAGAQLGTVSVAGTLVSGGTLSYQFDLNVLTNAGPLVVKATVSGKKFKAKFPVLTITSPLLGTNADVQGTFVSIPTNFTGVVTMKVTATFHRRNIGSRKLRATITAELPPSAATTVSTNLYDVGFENPVTLDGSIVPTTGLTGTVTYAWSQTSGKTVALGTNGLVSTSFTTDALTNFVDLGTTNFVNDIDDSGFTNQLYVAPEHRFGTDGGISLDNQQATAATYGFKVLVSDGSVTRTGLFTVACSLQTPAQPNVPVGVTAFYRGATNSMNWSLVSRPSGSVATLAHTNGLIAALRPDVEGVYVIQDNVTGKTVTNTAASWTGVQFCAICHGSGNNVGQADIVTPWSQTLHATMAQRGVDGANSSHYNESCFQCHTVGFNQSPAATNNNFYAVQQQLGWTFPTVLQAGNYALMPAQLQNLANIQCENCHGPGSRHPGAPSISLDEKVCASCHQNGTNHVHPEQWEVSPHAGAYERVSFNEGLRSDCARCHSPVGFTAVEKGTADVTNTNSIPTGTGPLTCQACHDPHDTHGNNPDRHQLRVYDNVLLGIPYFRSNTVTVGLGDSLTTADLRLTNSNLVVTNLGASAACIVCHNERQLPTQTVLYGTNTVLSSKTLRPTTVGVSKYYQITSPHDQTAGEAFLGIGAYDYGQAMGNSFHTHLADCQTCHMYVLRAPSGGVAQDAIAINDVVTNVTTALYNQYANLLGDHTFEMSYQSVGANGATNTVDDIAACNQCHASFEPVDSFDFKPANAQDYDGNGVIEGIRTETQGLLNNLGFLLKTTGVTITTNASGQVTSVSTSAGYSTNNVALAEAQYKAAWNWLLEYREGSFGVHNTQFTVRLLQTSYTDLSTNYYSDVTRTYQNAYTNAFLR